MDAKSQTSAFADDLDRMVDRYRDEFDLTYAAVIGVLYMKAQLMCVEASATKEQEDGD